MRLKKAAPPTPMNSHPVPPAPESRPSRMRVCPCSGWRRSSVEDTAVSLERLALPGELAAGSSPASSDCQWSWSTHA